MEADSVEQEEKRRLPNLITHQENTWGSREQSYSGKSTKRVGTMSIFMEFLDFTYRLESKAVMMFFRQSYFSKSL